MLAAISAAEATVNISTMKDSNESSDIVGPTIISSTTCGIYINGGALTVGKTEPNPSINKYFPSITGKSNGVEIHAGTFNFYGGTIKGKNSAIQGTPIIPAGYRRADSTDSDGFKTVWLEIDE